jgi:peptidoglycan/LPS O-acetylase OafA/YrhL
LRKWWPVVVVAVGGPLFAWWAFGLATINPSISSQAVDWTWFGTFFACGAVLSGLPALRTPKVSAALILTGVIAFAAGSQVIGLALALPSAAILVGSQYWPVLGRAGRFGDFSYGLYLWGWPVQQVVATHLGVQAGYWRLLLVSLAGTTVLAVLSWHLVEKWALAAKPSSRTKWPRALTLELK